MSSKRPLILSREDALVAEEERLATFAVRSSASRGRRVPESEDALRTAFQRDRDRIIHSTAFRRLIGKTQVFVSDTGDHFRTRLTHSLEVAQVARSVSRSLRLNEDLTEALALAHDLGHPPFGHSGGDVLDALMASHGGFEHNRQALRVVDHLEMKDPRFPGLNLSYEVRESILKHHRPFKGPEYSEYAPQEGPCLEAQVVDHADGIAYNAADLDDGLRAGIIRGEELAELSLWREARDEVVERHPGTEGRSLERKTVAQLIGILVTSLLRESAARLEGSGVRSLADVRAEAEPLIAFEEAMRLRDEELRAFLHGRFYTDYRVCRMRSRATVLLEGLFAAYHRSRELMPPRFQRRAEEEGLERTIADYISGMTDRYAQREYAMLFSPGAGSLDP